MELLSYVTGWSASDESKPDLFFPCLCVSFALSLSTIFTIYRSRYLFMYSVRTVSIHTYPRISSYISLYVLGTSVVQFNFACFINFHYSFYISSHWVEILDSDRSFLPVIAVARLCRRKVRGQAWLNILLRVRVESRFSNLANYWHFYGDVNQGI